MYPEEAVLEFEFRDGSARELVLLDEDALVPVCQGVAGRGVSGFRSATETEVALLALQSGTVVRDPAAL